MKTGLERRVGFCFVSLSEVAWHKAKIPMTCIRFLLVSGQGLVNECVVALLIPSFAWRDFTPNSIKELIRRLVDFQVRKEYLFEAFHQQLK